MSTTPPGSVLDLTNWYLTLPCGEVDSPDLIDQPELDTFIHEQFFHVSESDPTFVVFKAYADGVTTANTSNPRSELREMNGSDKAKWSTTVGKHTLTVRQQVMALPEGKPSVVIAQIHKGSDDLIEVRCWIPDGRTSPIIDVFHNSKVYGTLKTGYVFGTPYILSIKADSGSIRVFYNGKQKLSIPSSCSTCFFKTGCYCQANTSDDGVTADQYAEVWISDINVTHTQ